MKILVICILKLEDRSIHEGVIKHIEDEICNLYDEIGLTKVDDDRLFWSI